MSKASEYKLTIFGQSLFEVILTIGVAAIIIVGIVSLSTKSLANTNTSNDRSQATRFAQEMIECLRRERDTNWGTFVSGGQSTCLLNPGTPFTVPLIAFACFESDGTTPVSGCTPISDVGIVEARVVVEWQDGSGTHQVDLISRFSDWERAR